MQVESEKDKQGEHHQEHHMVRDLPTFNLRMPRELRQQIEKQAEISGRSMNAEIIHRLTASLERKLRRGDGHHGGDKADGLSELEDDMIQIFRRLKPDRQLAMLTLFK